MQGWPDDHCYELMSGVRTQRVQPLAPGHDHWVQVKVSRLQVPIKPVMAPAGLNINLTFGVAHRTTRNSKLAVLAQFQ